MNLRARTREKVLSKPNLIEQIILASYWTSVEESMKARQLVAKL
jgi:hypothetical protein